MGRSIVDSDMLRHPEVVSNVAPKDGTDSPSSFFTTNAVANSALSAYPAIKHTKGKLLLRAGYGLRNLASGSIAGAAIATPIDYWQQKEYDRFKNDKDFNVAHFGRILVPSIVGGSVGTGIATNTMGALKASGKLGTKKTVQAILSPKRIGKATTRELSSIGKALKGKKIGKGLFGMGLLGLSLLNPILYAVNTLGKKKEKNTTGNILTKSASGEPVVTAEKIKDTIKKRGKTAVKIYLKVSPEIVKTTKRGIGYGIIGTGALALARKQLLGNEEHDKNYNQYPHTALSLAT